jgi:O6-methylguanine-DNA--protein-cysteine methyltransferase
MEGLSNFTSQLIADSFSEKVCMTLYKRVEFGQTVTYKGLAEMVGNPGESLRSCYTLDQMDTDYTIVFS